MSESRADKAQLDDQCPCCKQIALTLSDAFYRCGHCQHTWQKQLTEYAVNYAQLSRRNQEQSPSFQRKISDRLQTLSDLLFTDSKVLEVGCAEGGLGAMIKQKYSLQYDAVEPSQDAEIAEQRLDKVYRDVKDIEPTQQYDLVLAFHVLEHIDTVSSAIITWKALLKPNGKLLLEVPNKSGNPFLAIDRHPEHLHQFSVASLVILITRLGMVVTTVSTGHFESSLYHDSIRLLASPCVTEQQRLATLQQRCQHFFPQPVLIYGLGGDFANCVQPLLEIIPVAGLRDGAVIRQGNVINGHTVKKFDPDRDEHYPVLIASLHFEDEILQDLLSMGVGREHIVTLSELYGDD